MTAPRERRGLSGEVPGAKRSVSEGRPGEHGILGAEEESEKRVTVGSAAEERENSMKFLSPEALPRAF